MAEATKIVLYFAPTNQYVEACIVPLTEVLIDRGITNSWWNDNELKRESDAPAIDRYWNWADMGIEFEGVLLEAAKYGLVTGDGMVQGAMLISIDGVPSVLQPGMRALFLELLFTAPRNRPALRVDGEENFVGVGTQLLRYGAALSRELGCDGRIRLDASPDYVVWYEKRGLQKLSLNPIVFEGVRYTPMELSAAHAQVLLSMGRNR